MSGEERAHTLRYRWVVLAVGALGAGAFNSLRMGLPAISPELRSTYALSLPEVGLAFTALSVGVLVTLVPWGLLSDRIGERPVMTVGLTGTAAALLLAASARSFGALLAAFALAGMFGASATGASGRAVMGWFPRRERGFALGIRQMALPLGGAIAAVTLPALAHRGGLELALHALAGACAGAAVAAAIWLRPAPPLPAWQAARIAAAHAGEPPPTRDPRAWRLGAGSALLVTAQAALIGFLVLYLVDVEGLAPGPAAAALAATQFAGAMSRIVAGRSSDRAGARLPLLRRIARRNALLLAAVAALVALGTPLAIPLALAATVSTMSWNGLAFTAAGEISGRDRAGVAMSLQNTIVALGTTVAPAVFGLVVASTSWALGFALVAVAPALAVVVLAPLEGDETARNARRERARRSRPPGGDGPERLSTTTLGGSPA
ncbi:MFS transporter [Paraconexibacter algicola]|uniref:MFS transporter n=1 Tax=Paraconexibacter algicola TaxID=2133960 RepID=A0A2T4UJI6_9ACTN|nr:MFS transporter [Paraconexibacter algicola]PTL59400.1 MFS transporter [Paraconexibacter algicola]